MQCHPSPRRQELGSLSAHPRNRAKRCVAFPAHGSKWPVWILGSSLYGVRQLAAALGLPYAFASSTSVKPMTGFRCEAYSPAISASRILDQPYVMSGAELFAA